MAALESVMELIGIRISGPRAPQPLPLQNGFSADRLYRVLGIYNASESSDAFFILANDRNQM